MKKHVTSVGLGVELERVEVLRAKLLAEVAECERQQSQLKLHGTCVNFTMIQTYKELIASRKDMLRRLPESY